MKFSSDYLFCLSVRIQSFDFVRKHMHSIDFRWPNLEELSIASIASLSAALSRLMKKHFFGWSSYRLPKRIIMHNRFIGEGLFGSTLNASKLLGRHKLIICRLFSMSIEHTNIQDWKLKFRRLSNSQSPEKKTVKNDNSLFGKRLLSTVGSFNGWFFLMTVFIGWPAKNKFSWLFAIKIY